MDSTENKIILSWTAPEFIRYEKTKSWFVGLGIITVGFFIVSLLMKNYFFALIVPIAAFLIYIHAQKYPRKLTVSVTEDGIEIENFLSIQHKDIAYFWIFKEFR